VFNTHGKIYEQSASKISGVPFHEFMFSAGYTADELLHPDWYTRKPSHPTDKHHPLRKTIGKVAELASGYGGWIGAWKNFGADKFLTEKEIKDSILAWRKASPMIVEFWGGQFRGNWEYKRPERYGLEGMAINAIEHPGIEFGYRDVTYYRDGDALYCRLPSGRLLTYNSPRLRPSERGGLAISYSRWNTNKSNGAVNQWITVDTYGGRLCENVVQAVARDIQRHSILGLEAAGYPVVLHVYDEDISEVPEGYGSIDEFESIMSTMPDWAAGWPIRANGGFRAKRYRK
jgi:DNA polymerase